MMRGVEIQAFPLDWPSLVDEYPACGDLVVLGVRNWIQWPQKTSHELAPLGLLVRDAFMGYRTTGMEHVRET